jgi:hypothetical protein
VNNVERRRRISKRAVSVLRGAHIVSLSPRVARKAKTTRSLSVKRTPSINSLCMCIAPDAVPRAEKRQKKCVISLFGALFLLRWNWFGSLRRPLRKF